MSLSSAVTKAPTQVKNDNYMLSSRGVMVLIFSDFSQLKLELSTFAEFYAESLLKPLPECAYTAQAPSRIGLYH